MKEKIMKRKIPLMLVLGIVGVLVVSFIIGSRASATFVMDVEVCETGYGCDFIGYVDIGVDIADTTYDIIDEWRTEDVEWQNIDDTEDLMDYSFSLGSALSGSNDLQYAFAVFDDISEHIIYYEGFDESDLGSYTPAFDISFDVSEMGQSSSGGSYFDIPPPTPSRGLLLISYTFGGGTISYDISTGRILEYHPGDY